MWALLCYCTDDATNQKPGKSSDIWQYLTSLLLLQWCFPAKFCARKSTRDEIAWHGKLSVKLYIVNIPRRLVRNVLSQRLQCRWNGHREKRYDKVSGTLRVFRYVRVSGVLRAFCYAHFVTHVPLMVIWVQSNVISSYGRKNKSILPFIKQQFL